MDTILIPLMTAFSVGIGCGTCCSPFVSAFLSAYIVSRSEGVKKSLGTLAGFFMGKLLGISALCLTAAGIGRKFLSETGYIGCFPFRLAVQLAMSLFGIIMAARWLWNIRRGKMECENCGRQKGEDGKTLFRQGYSMFMAGLLYGITPCPPLVMMIGYSASLSVFSAGMAGVSFGLASIVSPLLMLAVVLGALSKRIRAEIPNFLKWFRFISYMILAVLPFTLA